MTDQHLNNVMSQYFRGGRITTVFKGLAHSCRAQAGGCDSRRCGGACDPALPRRHAERLRFIEDGV
jgi:hypothetical protein